MAKKKIEPEPQVAQRFRNRIKELRMVKASELKRNPKNFRRHPDSQKKALEAVLSEVGYADALIAREDAEGLLLLDGHLRADLDSESIVPVLVLDVNEKEGDLILATLDPLAGLAEQDDEALKNLLEGIETENEELQKLLDGLAGDTAPIEQGLNDIDAEWQGMPEFEHDTSLQNRYLLKVNFRTQDDMEAFGLLLNQPITEKTKEIWYSKN